MSKIFDLLVDSIKNIKNSNLLSFGITDREVSDYIDEEILNGNIVKHSYYIFTCHGLVEKINKSLTELNSNIHLVAEDEKGDNKQICVRIKGGQCCYFLLYENNIAVKSGILTWSVKNTIVLFNVNES